MRTSISRAELGNDLLYDTLSALYKVLSNNDVPVYVVGATSRDITMKLIGEDEARRRTFDLDVAIAIPDWDMFDKIQGGLLKNHFSKSTAKQKFIYHGENDDNNYEVDIVPFGGVAIDEEIRWRPDGVPVMSVKSFNDVMAKAIEVIIGEVPVRIATLSGQFLIKLDAWLDRNDRTSKDAYDMLYILSKYFYSKLLQSDSQIPDDVDLSVEDNTDGQIIYGSMWLASDLRQVLSTKHLEYYVGVISDEVEKGPKSRLLQHFINYMDIDDDDNYTNIYNVWSNICRILNAELARRKNES